MARGGRDAYGVDKQRRAQHGEGRGRGGATKGGVSGGAGGRGSASSRAKEHYDSATKSIKRLKEGGGGVRVRSAGGGQAEGGGGGVHIKLGPERAAERLALQKRAEQLEKRAEQLEAYNSAAERASTPRSGYRIYMYTYI